MAFWFMDATSERVKFPGYGLSFLKFKVSSLSKWSHGRKTDSQDCGPPR